MTIRIGCAGWTVPPSAKHRFPPEGSHLERYAAVFDAVEINSSFYREHRETTYARWAASVPGNFRFAVKLPRWISHRGKLAAPGEDLARFLQQIRALGRKSGPILVQFPPSLAYDGKRAPKFFSALRRRYRGAIACEPRHRSWFDSAADDLLARFRVARVAADPARFPNAGSAGGWRRLAYFRLHGSPRVYYSSYSEEYLESLAQTIAEFPARVQVWCIFNNTAAGAAADNALRLKELLDL